jgi:hypothetical protein
MESQLLGDREKVELVLEPAGMAVKTFGAIARCDWFAMSLSEEETFYTHDLWFPNPESRNRKRRYGGICRSYCPRGSGTFC